MKTFLLIYCILLSALLPVKSQELDSGNIKITYTLNYVGDSTNLQKISNDQMILIAGKSISVFYSYKQFLADSLLQADEKKGVSQADMLSNLKKYKGSKNKYTIYKNYPANKITTYDKIGRDNFKYEEPLTSPNWTITNEKTKILSYTCQKAVAYFLGRNYVAWFTKDIAVNSGPWKFSGLPGLILRVNDTRKHYNFECVGIEVLKPGKPIVVPKENYITATKQEFQKTFKRFMADPMGYLQSSSGAEIKMEGNNNSQGRPYNPIEL